MNDQLYADAPTPFSTGAIARADYASNPNAGRSDAQSAGLPIRIALSDYDRTRPLINGRVKLPGISPSYFMEDIGTFCMRPVYEEFDVAEMSFSWFVAARSRGEPVVGLPIFPLRMPVFAYMFCRSDAPYEKPSDLIGKRIGSKGYRYTVNLWLRGLLNDYYGLAPEQVTWVTSAVDEGAGFVIPDGIKVEVDTKRSDEQLLLAGEIDAIFSPVIPDAFMRGDNNIRRLFPDAAKEQADFFSRVGIYPITHLMVAGEKVIRDNPQLAKIIFDGFTEAQDVLNEYYMEAKHLASPEAIFMLESTRRRYGDGIWRHGYAANKLVVDSFVRYAHEQGYTDRLLSAEEIFAPGTMDF